MRSVAGCKAVPPVVRPMVAEIDAWSPEFKFDDTSKRAQF
jgi:hypothetical protein